MKSLTAALILISLIGLSYAGETITFNVTGEARIENGDTLLARHIAIGYAITSALDQAIKQFLPNDVIEANRDIINRNVLVNHLGYLNKLSITEVQVKNSSSNTYSIKASIAIEMSILKAKLKQNKLLDFRQNLPKVISFVQEKNIDNVHWHFQMNTFNNTELTIWKILDLKGYTKDIQAQVLSNITSDAEQSFYGDDNSVIAGQASGMAADIIIVGKSISRPIVTLESEGDSISAVAMVTIRAIRAVDARELGSSSTSATVKDTSESTAGALAIGKAAEEAVINLLPALSEDWSSGLEPVVSFTMFVSGLKSLESLISFKNEFLNSVDEIQKFERRTFSSGAAAYDVESTLDIADIVATLKAKGLESFDINIRSHSENSIDIRVKAK